MHMVINGLGFIAAITAFLSIWMGHVSVRKVEAETNHLWKAMVIYLVAGISLEAAAVIITDRAVSMVCGIIGFSLLWDVLELKRQARRVHRGHAPANPNNPRHSAMLALPPTRVSQGDMVIKAFEHGDPIAQGADLPINRQES